MKIKALYAYPIKALRGIELKSAQIGPQGIAHDRRFMLFEVRPPGTGQLRKMQLSSHPQCALFGQEIEPASSPHAGAGAAVVVRYHGHVSADDKVLANEGDESSLRIPLQPADLQSLEKINIDLHGSPTSAYRMGDPYDAWFSERFGFPTMLVYLGDGRRAVLGKTLLPKAAPEQQQQHQQQQNHGWLLASLASYVTSTASQPSDGGPPPPPPPWLTFADVAPLLVTSESSLRDVVTRLLDGQAVEMYKFRPNIVVDGEGEEAWAEDFWAELVVTTNPLGAEDGETPPKRTLLLTGNCARCTSLNVDYQTGKPAAGELGNVLKRLMKDRRVDPGIKWSPVFGRYAFVDASHGDGFTVSVGDDVEVTWRNTERTVWDWPGV